jgi:hypothetical protein
MIVPALARIIIREHMHRPLRGEILTLGRQTIAMTYEKLIDLFRQEGCQLSEDILKSMAVEKDQKTRVGEGTEFVSDDVFFKLLGVRKVTVMDVSSYEGCNIVHDLNKSIPESLIKRFDFIIDGGTFDHLFDIRIAFENVVKMLKVGGRIFQWNAASNFAGESYLSFGPDFFYDYYVLNNFEDCRVYIAEVDDVSDQYDHFRSNRLLMTLVLAEKGGSSTWDKAPIQAQYRDAYLWDAYRRGQKNILSSSRKSLSGSKYSVKLTKVNRIIRILSKLKKLGFYNFTNKVARELYKLIRGRLGYEYLGKI